MEQVMDVQAIATSTSARRESGVPNGITREDRRVYLSNLSALLNELTVRFARMMHGVSDAEMRAVFVEERPVVVQPLPDPAGRPRGREHPLITLVKLAIGSVRLQMRVLKLEAEEADVPGTLEQVDALTDFAEKLKGMARGLGIDPDAA